MAAVPVSNQASNLADQAEALLERLRVEHTGDGLSDEVAQARSANFRDCATAVSSLKSLANRLSSGSTGCGNASRQTTIKPHSIGALLFQGSIIPRKVCLGTTLLATDVAREALADIGFAVADSAGEVQDLLSLWPTGCNLQPQDVFFVASRPHNWSIRPGESRIELALYDTLGWRRAAIFYNGLHLDNPGPDDQRAELVLFRRYDVRLVPAANETASIKVIDGTTQKELLRPGTTKPAFPSPAFPIGDRAQREERLGAATAWLDELHPGWPISFHNDPWWRTAVNPAMLAGIAEPVSTQ